MQTTCSETSQEPASGNKAVLKVRSLSEGSWVRTVPKRQSGKDRNIQMRSTTTMEPKGTAASEWYAIAMVLSTDAMLKHSSGNRLAVSSMVGIHVFPPFRA